MKISHLHVGVKDLTGAVSWMSNILNSAPDYQNIGMASFSLENIALVIDASETETEVTIALGSKDCSFDFKSYCDRGAIAIEQPKDQPWGVKTAYFHGPGKIVFEIEQVLP